MPVEELFPGLAEAAQMKVVGRKQALLTQLRVHGDHPVAVQKRIWLRTTMAGRSLTSDDREGTA